MDPLVSQRASTDRIGNSHLHYPGNGAYSFITSISRRLLGLVILLAAYTVADQQQLFTGRV